MTLPPQADCAAAIDGARVSWYGPRIGRHRDAVRSFGKSPVKGAAGGRGAPMAVAARFPRGLCLAGACAALLAFAGGARAAELLNVRLGYHADKTRVVFDLDTAAGYRIARQSNSELVIEFDARASEEAIPGNGKPLRWVTIEGEGGRSRVRMILAGPVKLNAQVLRRPDRVVLDLLPPTAAAPRRKPAPKPAAAPAPEPKPAPPPEPEFATAESEPAPLAPLPALDDSEPLLGGKRLFWLSVWTLLAALAVGTGLALRRRRAALSDDGWGPVAAPAAPVVRRGEPAPPVAAPAPPAAPAANPGLDESNERRIARLEKRMEAMLDSRERLEIQLAKQAEEQRVLRAALASIQHKLRGRGRGDGDGKD